MLPFFCAEGLGGAAAAADAVAFSCCHTGDDVPDGDATAPAATSVDMIVQSYKRSLSMPQFLTRLRILLSKQTTASYVSSSATGRSTWSFHCLALLLCMSTDPFFSVMPEDTCDFLQAISQAISAAHDRERTASWLRRCFDRNSAMSPHNVEESFFIDQTGFCRHARTIQEGRSCISFAVKHKLTLTQH